MLQSKKWKTGSLDQKRSKLCIVSLIKLQVFYGKQCIHHVKSHSDAQFIAENYIEALVNQLVGHSSRLWVATQVSWNATDLSHDSGDTSQVSHQKKIRVVFSICCLSDIADVVVINNVQNSSQCSCSCYQFYQWPDEGTRSSSWFQNDAWDGQAGRAACHLGLALLS